jgi:hypothetical protein
MPSRPTTKDLEDYRRGNALRVAMGNHQIAECHSRAYTSTWGAPLVARRVYDVVNYLFGDLCPNSVSLYWRAGCRHGTATISHGWAEEMFSLAGRWHNMLQTEEQAVARLPERCGPSGASMSSTRSLRRGIPRSGGPPR